MPRVYRKLQGAGRRLKYEPEQLAAAVRDVRTALTGSWFIGLFEISRSTESKSIPYKRGCEQDFFVYPEIPDVVNVRIDDISLEWGAMIERRGRYYPWNLDSRKYSALIVNPWRQWRFRGWA